MKNNVHNFDIRDAQKHGVSKAILLYNIRFWLEHSKANKKNIHKKGGVKYYWTYNSSKAFAELFPYFNERSISRWILELEKDGELISGTFNKTKYDKTKWYTIKDYATESDKTLSQNDQSKGQDGEPIPNINTDSTYSNAKALDTSESKKELTEEFRSNEYIEKLCNSKRADIALIGRYMMLRGMDFPSKKTADAELKRNIRVANELMDYPKERRTEAYERAKELTEYWNLDTMRKLINKN